MDEKFSYRHKTWYGITIKPSDQLQYKRVSDRLKAFHNHYYEQFLPYQQKGIMHSMFVEVSQPAGEVIKPPRMHLHGILYFEKRDSVLNYLLYQMPKTLTEGHIHIFELDLIKGTSRFEWYKYITKQKKLIPKKYFIISNFIDPKEILAPPEGRIPDRE